MIVFAKLKVKSGKESEMEQAGRDMVAKVQDEEGTLAYSFHRSQIDPTVFVFYEKYRDAAAFQHHSTTPYLQDFFAKSGDWMDGSPEIQIFDEISSISR
ncbi:MAG: putative quinol monooxygenase [Chloroflexota bacterium]|nr:putative quinol monooxygenase [Chloroflexota bacterium]